MALSGSLREFALSEILQLLSSQRKTGSLRLTRGSEMRVVYLLEGRIASMRDRGYSEEDPLARAPRIETPFGGDVVVLNATLASSVGVRSASGFYLDNVQPGGGLRNLGLQTGDVLLALNGRALDSGDDVPWMVETFESGGPIELYVERGGVTTRLLIR